MRLKFSKLLLTALLICLSVSVFAQNVTIKCDNEPLRQILDKISSQTEKSFAFSNELDIRGIQTSLQVENRPLAEVLDKLLEPLGISYVINGGQILLRPAEKRSDNSKTDAPTVDSNIKGRVTDSQTGDPIMGVFITVKGNNKVYAMTDNYGNYEIKASPTDVLSFSMMGLKTEDVAVGGSKIIDIAMSLDAVSLDDVVVTGYQTLSRERATGAFSVITSKDLQNRITPNIIDRLEGLTTGLTLDKDNNIIIRGVGTLYGDSQPLIVLDGFPIEGGLSTISPEDIESITVLKDASAASIWGTKAANGVIVITSKEGLANTGVQVDASYYSTVSMKQDIDDLYMMNSEEKIDFLYHNIVEKNAGYSLNQLGNAYDGQGSYHDYYDTFNPFFEAFARFKSPALAPSDMISESQFLAELERLKKVNAYQQFEDSLLRVGTNHSANVSIKYNNVISSVVATFNYDGEKGSSVGNSNDRFIVNVRDKIQVLKNLELDLNANIIYQNATNNGMDASYFAGWMNVMEPFDAIMNPDGSRAYTYKANPFSRAYHESLGLNYNYNPIDQVENNDITTKGLSTRLQAALAYEVFKGLKISSQYQYERNHNTYRNYQSPNSPDWRNILNNFWDGKQYLTLPYGGNLYKSTAQTAAWTWRNQATFNKSIDDDKHLITAIAGFEMRKNVYNADSFSLLGYDEQTASGVLWDQYSLEGDDTALARSSEAYMSGYSGPGVPTTAIVDTRERAYFANASYALDNKYTVSGSFRLDQASLFGFKKGARNNYLWSAGASWNAKKENFLKDASWLDRLVVRLTYGVNGNRPAPQFTSYMTGSVSQMSSRLSTAGTKLIELTNPSNPNLRSERVYTANFGIDFAFLDSRIYGTLELYNKDSKDLIGPKALDYTTGWLATMINYASMNNKGAELLLTVIPVRTKDWYWDVNLNFSYNNNKVTSAELNHTNFYNLMFEVTSDYSGSAGLPVVGKPIGRLYAYDYAGLNENGEVMLYDLKGEKYHWWDEFTGANEFNLDKYEYMGSIHAPIFGSLGTNLSWKNFTFGFNINYKFGSVMRAPLGNGPNYVLTAKQTLSKGWVNQWKKPGDEATTNVPMTFVNDWDSFQSIFMDSYYVMADICVEDASYIKLRDVHIDYKLPAKLCKRIGLRDVIFKLQAHNLGKWVANSWGYDPEYYTVVERGFSSAHYLLLPNPTTYTLGINFGF